ncbi:MAG: hypothetical protein KDA45_00820 [Planctomycetales bacterium]|nr:hypothetical protein [Planctomycetales bacterium]
MNPSASPDEQPYHVVAAAGEYQIQDDQGRTVMVCRDTRSATHYSTLLIQAFQRGYRAGYRAAKLSQP